MGLFDVFKGKPKSLEVPSAPPSFRTLPDVPSDLPEFPEIETEPSKVAASIERFEKGAVREELGELEEREHLSLKKPIFVDLDLFKSMMDEVGMTKKNLKAMDDGISRLEDFRGDKQKEFEKWRKALEDIQRKLIYADRTLFGR